MFRTKGIVCGYYVENGIKTELSYSFGGPVQFHSSSWRVKFKNNALYNRHVDIMKLMYQI